MSSQNNFPCGSRESAASIAVIGMSCRFPGAENLGAYERVLREGIDCIGRIPADRWTNPETDFAPDLRRRVETGGFLPRVWDFDPEFFGIQEIEAEQMDPQQRLLLEVAQEALDDAALSSNELRGGDIGVFIGASTQDAIRAYGDLSQLNSYSATGLNMSILSARLSYFFDWRGPAVTYDTACSSGLVAVLNAARSLESGECDLAMAGGVNLILDPASSLALASAGVLSSGGRCRPFDAAADGIVRGEGGGIVVLKRLDEAVRDQDRIYAVFRDGAINQDGRSAHLMAPNSAAQESLLRRLYNERCVSPASVDYVEAHGTGTALGDHIETLALGRVLGKAAGRVASLGIGSVKSNLGHTEAAAGIAGFIKAVYMLAKGVWPPGLNFETGNPHIPFESLGLEVIDRNVRRAQPPRLIGVSAFGFGGTNAHVVLERFDAAAPRLNVSPDTGYAPQQTRDQTEKSAAPIRMDLAVLSAPTRMDLARQATALADFLDREDSLTPQDIVTTLARRTHHAFRLAVPVESGGKRARHLKDFRDILRDTATSLDNGNTPPAPVVCSDSPTSRPDGVVFLFSGTGAQSNKEGAELIESYPVFRESFEDCEGLLSEFLGFRLRTEWERVDRAERSNDPELTHCSLIVLQMALSDLWCSFGLRPAAVVGHSVGEISAAYAAGFFSRREAMRVLATRCEALRSEFSKGAMLTVNASDSEVHTLVSQMEAGNILSIAAINSPNQSVLSGSIEAIQAFAARCEKENLRVKILEGVTFASHGPAMAGPARGLSERLGAIETQDAHAIMVSTVTGQPVEAAELNAEYWARNLREPVLALKAVENAGLYFPAFLEIGPSAMLAQTVEAANAANIYCAALRPGRPESVALRDAVAKLFCAGFDLVPEYAGPGGRVVSLIPYQFQRHELRLIPPQSRRLDCKEFLAQTDQLARELEPEFISAEVADNLPRFYELCDALALISIRIAVLGIANHKHDVATGFKTLYARWIEDLRRADAKSPAAKWTRPELESERARLELTGRSEFAAYKHLFEYLVNSGRALGQIVTGRRTALEFIFPNGSYEVAHAMYRHWPPARFLNHLIDGILKLILPLTRPDRPLRILEIGAGTGATTSALLPGLAGKACEYYFTDLSELFLIRARDEFENFDFVNYVLLDIENPFESQHVDFRPGSFDVIIGTNVVHAVNDLNHTLGHIHRALQPDGVLILNELTEYGTRFDATTALIEGWQRFDDEWREGVPILDDAKWKKALHANGFSLTRTVSADSPFAGTGGQSLILGCRSERWITLSDINARHAAYNSPVSPSDLRLRAGASAMDYESHSPATPGEIRMYLERELKMMLQRFETDKHSEFPLSFFGFDSLMGVELRGKLRRQLNVEIAPTDLPPQFALNDILKLILRKRGKDRLHEDSNVPFELLQSGPDPLSILLLHPGGLPGSAYRTLLPAFARHSVYFFQPEELSTHHQHAGGETLEWIAKKYSRIFDNFFQGPVILIGWSLAGLLALQIAQQFPTQSRTAGIQGIVLLDSDNGPGADQSDFDRWFDMYRAACDIPDTLPLTKLRDAYAAGILRAYELIAGGGFVPPRVPAWLVEAETKNPADQRKEVQALFANCIRLTTPGDHYTMLLEANSEKLRAIFSRILLEFVPDRNSP